MSHLHDISQHEIGRLRIYMTRGDSVPAAGWKKFFGTPLFRHLVNLAQKDGILHATTHSTPYGFAQGKNVSEQHPEYSKKCAVLYVELTAERQQLEEFVKAHGELLQDKEMTYKHMERWKLASASQSLRLISVPAEL